MAKIVVWHGVNKVLNAPANEDKSRIQDLPVFNNGWVSVSCWQMTPEELKDMVENGGKVYLAVLFGPSQPPVFVGTEDRVREIALDHGGTWAKQKKDTCDNG